MTHSTLNVVDMSQPVVVTLFQFEILAPYIEEDIFKLAGELFRRASIKTLVEVLIFETNIPY